MPAKKRRVIESDDEPEDSENTDLNKIIPKETKRPASRSLPSHQPKAKSDTPKAKVTKKKPVEEKMEIDGDNDEPAAVEKDALMMIDNVNKVWGHDELDFLKPEKIRDKNRNRPGHPEYDPRTVYVPPEFFKDLTPAMTQWWKLKADYFDCIFFFKVGKFYELYNHDAVIGVNELGFTFMGKDTYAHSGFPEQAYEKMASTLVERGYKVARVEQTENPGKLHLKFIKKIL